MASFNGDASFQKHPTNDQGVVTGYEHFHRALPPSHLFSPGRVHFSAWQTAARLSTGTRICEKVPTQESSKFFQDANTLAERVSLHSARSHLFVFGIKIEATLVLR